MSYWELVEPYWEAVSIYEGGNAFLTGFKAIPVASQHLLAAHWAQSEISNGGFWQFCANSTGVLAPEAKIAFEVIGMPKTAALVTKYLAYWGVNYPRDKEERENIWSLLAQRDGYNEGYIYGFDDLDDPFFELLSNENGGFKYAADTYAANIKST